QHGLIHPVRSIHFSYVKIHLFLQLETAKLDGAYDRSSQQRSSGCRFFSRRRGGSFYTCEHARQGISRSRRTRSTSRSAATEPAWFNSGTALRVTCSNSQRAFTDTARE